MDGYNNRLKQEAKNIDTLNHIFGNYIMSAVHEPKKYPREPYMVEEEKREALISRTDESRIARVRKLYGKRKDGNGN